MPDIPVQSVGLFWQEEDVFWGAGSKSGKLLGVPSGNISATPVDFRNQVGIYILYDDYTPIYVGQSGGGKQKLFSRLKHHRNGRDDLAGRWNRFSWFGTLRVLGNGKLAKPAAKVHVTLNVLLNHLEGILIHSIEPPMNGQAGRFGNKVTRYVQVRDERLGPEDRKLIELIARHGKFDPKKLKRKGKKWIVQP